ncbi:MAG: hypothetical protein Q8O14_01655 [bacterium]|nr:hypothetical protein [bacterium]
MKHLLPLLAGALLLLGACNTAYQSTARPDEPSAGDLSEAELQARELEMRRHISFAYEYFKQNNFIEAKPYYLKAFALDDRNTQATHLKRLATCYMQLGDQDSARVVLQRAVELLPDSWYEHRTLGDLLQRSGDKNAAFAEFRIAAGLKEDDWESRRDMMAILKERAEASDATEDWDAVLELLDQLIVLQPEEMRWARSKDEILSAHYDPEEVIASLRQNQAQFPQDLTIRQKLVSALVEFATPASYREALGLVDELIAAQPEQVRPYDLKATALEGLGRAEEAAVVLATLFERKPDQTDLPARIGELYLTQDNLRQARRWALRSKSAFPSYGKGGLLLARVYVASVNACAGSELNFDDKLVYELAAREFDAVADPAFRGAARQGRASLEEVLPTAEDRFFNKYDRPKKDCYRWLFE